ncbi:MAG: hypothetical protein Q4F78_07130 [Bacillota bacterium]|nr:hypothetical protein [Bacillota bacterium]
MKKIIALIFFVMIVFTLASCGEPADGDGTDMQWDPKTADTVNLAELPKGAQMIPFEQFKKGFAFVSNTNWAEPPATYEEVAQAFGEEGLYYEKCDVIDDGITYKTYAWFSDEEWLDSTVSVAVSFKVDKETGKLIYYSYVSQGIDYTEV